MERMNERGPTATRKLVLTAMLAYLAPFQHFVDVLVAGCWACGTAVLPLFCAV